MNRRIGFTLAAIMLLAATSLTYCAVKVQKSKPKPRPAVTSTTEQHRSAEFNVSVAPIKPAKIRTGKDFEEALSRFHHRTLIEAYKQHGMHDAKWDDKAVAFMEDYIGVTLSQDTSAGPGLAKKAQELIDLGCTDPLVRSLCGISFMVNQEDAKATPVLLNATHDLAKSSYCGWRIAAAVEYLSNLCVKNSLEFDGDEGDELMHSHEYWARSLSDGSYLPGEERIMLRNFQRLYGNTNYGLPLDITKGAPAAAKYLINVTQAEDEMRQAWKARGGGWAYQVDEKQWQGMSEHFAAARKLLVEAWKLHPDFPEAPSMMIEVAMADAKSDNGTPRQWFDRAVEAQFDWQPAYTAYRRAILPRWSGSSDEMYAFGVRCLETGRFDTEVPWDFFRALREITDDLDGDKRYWRKPETAKHLETLYDGYAKTHPAIPNHYKTLRAITAWYVGDYTKAKVLLDQLGDKYSRDAFDANFHVKYDFVRKQVNMRAGEFSADIAHLDRLADSGKYDEALQLAKTMMPKAKDDEYTMEYLNKGVYRMQVLSSFGKGQWAALKLNSSFTGWNTGGSKWEAEPDGTLVGIPPGGNGPGTVLLSDMGFGKRFEIKGEIEFTARKTVERNAGLVFQHPSMFVTVLFNRDADKVTVSNLGLKDSASVTHAGVADKNTFLVQYWDGEITAYMNGKLLKRAVPVDQFGSEDLQVGLISLMVDEAEKVKFRSLQIHKLAKRP
jgi:hypothetical protein